jgi:hypothetical protein
VICMRTTDQPVPAVRASRLVCSHCAQPVWISVALLDALGGPEKVEPICTWCVPPDATVSIHPVTAREVAEWLDAHKEAQSAQTRS